jgi:hypothetical protein
MKTKCLRACILSMAAGGISMLVSGCVVYPNGTVGLQPLIIAAPAPVEPVMVPDSYVWDGVEFIGVVGGAYFYLGPGNVWLACDPVRLERFHGWERHHPDWRDHAIRNDRFRKDAHGHIQPMGHGRPENGKAAPKSEKDEQH